MNYVHNDLRDWVRRALDAVRRRCGDKAYVVWGAAISLLLFSQLASQHGLFELGDANFPLRPFALDYFSPWQERAAAGVDNVFIGVPRLAYYGSINLALFVFQNAQVAQWLWYSAVGLLGVVGAYRLASRLGAAAYAFPIALFYAFNLWSYDRVAQTPLFLAYQAAPLTLFLLLRASDRRRLIDVLVFGLSVVLVLPAFQIAYLVMLASVAVVLWALARRRTNLTVIGLLIAS